jgi:N-acetylneuraminic acid mutarotase
VPIFQPVAKQIPTRFSHFPIVFAIAASLFTYGCGGGSKSGGGGPTPPPTPSAVNKWTWESGGNMASTPDNFPFGVYGTKGIAADTNFPGARGGSVSWIDGSGNLWLFGGNGLGSTGRGPLNDLWEFNPTAKTWTWQSGSDSSSPDAAGVYGTQGIPLPNNVPGPRSGAVSWMDSSGNLWLFGGAGLTYPPHNPTDCNSCNTLFNDLWEFNPSTKEWTWVSGSNTLFATGVYGTLGIASASNVPGARGISGGSGIGSYPVGHSLSWIDHDGNLWLFGGAGLDSTGTYGILNDLWEFSPATKEWTWEGGSKTASGVGIYGTQGVASVNNVPGARGNALSWTDKSGNFWLYGGFGYGATNTLGFDLNDLWEFNPATKEWTWVNGSNMGGVVPVYGTQGVASASNTPGGRDSAVAWTDNGGNLWLFGGFDDDGGATNQDLNDLWEFSPATKKWTWVGGSNTGGAFGVYGTLGIASASNFPGARGYRGVSVAWTDGSGNFWLFGGLGYDSIGVSDILNDLWRYQP